MESTTSFSNRLYIRIAFQVYVASSNATTRLSTFISDQ